VVVIELENTGMGGNHVISTDINLKNMNNFIHYIMYVMFVASGKDSRDRYLSREKSVSVVISILTAIYATLLTESLIFQIPYVGKIEKEDNSELVFLFIFGIGGFLLSLFFFRKFRKYFSEEKVLDAVEKFDRKLTVKKARNIYILIFLFACFLLFFFTIFFLVSVFSG
jgi:Na+/proline symporter